jgi:hypothetical protein
MESLELLTQAQAAGIHVKIDDEVLSITGPPTAKALVNELIACKHEILSLLLGRQDAPSAVSDAFPSHPIAAGDERPLAPYIARCSQCGGARWGPTGTLLTETLRTGEQVQTEVWHCLNCASQPEATRPPAVPETIPPGSVESPCPQCNKSHRLLVQGSPHIPGEPDRDVLICGKCGHSELACPECKRSNEVQNSILNPDRK